MLIKIQNKNFQKPKVGLYYWTYNVVYLPIKVKVIEVDEKKQKAKIEQGWIDFRRLYETEEECPQR